MFDQLALPDEDIPQVDLSQQRVAELVGDIRRNSRNRRIAMVSVVVLAAAVMSAMLAAPSQHGGLALIADAESPDPGLPRVFGSNGVWSVAEPIEDAPAGDTGPADVIQVPTEPSAPSFTLSPPAAEDLHSLPASTSTPPTSTSGQSPPVSNPAERDWSAFRAVIRIETDPASSVQPPVASEAPAVVPEATLSPPDPSASAEDTTTPDPSSSDGDVTVAVTPQSEQPDSQPQANPSTPTDDPADSGATVFSAPAAIEPLSVLVYSAHVSVTVQVMDDDSSVIDWCSTRVDWGDGSVTRAAGADDAALCTALCEYESTSAGAGDISLGSEALDSINETVRFEHSYAARIDAQPRIFVATGDGCSYTLAELQLPPFNVDPLS